MTNITSYKVIQMFEKISITFYGQHPWVIHSNFIWISSSPICFNLKLGNDSPSREMEMSPCSSNFRHWLHWKFSFRFYMASQTILIIFYESGQDYNFQHSKQQNFCTHDDISLYALIILSQTFCCTLQIVFIFVVQCFILLLYSPLS